MELRKNFLLACLLSFSLCNWSGAGGMVARSKSVSYSRGEESSQEHKKNLRNKFEKVSSTVSYFEPAPKQELPYFRLGAPIVKVSPPIFTDTPVDPSFTEAVSRKTGPNEISITLPPISLPAAEINLEPDTIKVPTPRLVDAAPLVVSAPDVNIPGPVINIAPSEIVQGKPQILRSKAQVIAPGPVQLPGPKISVAGPKIITQQPVVNRPPAEVRIGETVNVPGPNIRVEGGRINVPAPSFNLLGGQKTVIQAKPINLPPVNVRVQPSKVDVSGLNVDVADPEIKFED